MAGTGRALTGLPQDILDMKQSDRTALPVYVCSWKGLPLCQFQLKEDFPMQCNITFGNGEQHDNNEFIAVECNGASISVQVIVSNSIVSN